MEVQIRRREEISHLPTKVINESKVAIGSHFDGRAPLSGLSKEDEKKYLPDIVGVGPDDPSFTQKVREYWATLTIPVPMIGTILDVTTDENGEPFSTNLEDWIKFQWAKKHKLVAMNEKEMKEDPRKQYYIYNPEDEINRQNQELQVKMKADAAFIKVLQSKDIDRVKSIIRIMDVINPDNLTDKAAQNKLYQLKEDKPQEFLVVATDKKLEVKAQIQELINQEILRKVGGQIIYIDQVIGETINDAVAWYTDARNSQTVADLKAKLKEMKKNR